MTQDSIFPAESNAGRAARLADFLRAQAAVRLVEQSRRVRRAERKLQALRDQQSALMAAGRRAGLPWDALASAAGVSRQAVQQRVNPLLTSQD